MLVMLYKSGTKILFSFFLNVISHSNLVPCSLCSLVLKKCNCCKTRHKWHLHCEFKFIYYLLFMNRLQVTWQAGCFHILPGHIPYGVYVNIIQYYRFKQTVYRIYWHGILKSYGNFSWSQLPILFIFMHG